VSASFSYLGRASDGAGNLTNVSGTFQTTFSNTTIAAIVAALGSGQAVVTSGSGTLAATAAAIPEPGSTSMAVIGGALLMLSAAARRKLRG